MKTCASEVAFCRNIPSYEKHPDTEDFAKIKGIQIPKLQKIPNPRDRNSGSPKTPIPKPTLHRYFY